jgi:tripartite-type tricarboxylate transporter receptor subunit TctC
MKIPRRRFLHQVAGAAALPALSRIAWAQAYPTRPVTIIVPFAAGGTLDITARVIGEHMSRTLGRQVVVENVVGAGGTIGSTRAMRAKPDGYTIELGHSGTHAFAVALYPKLAYRPDVDFQPIGEVSMTPMLIVARKDFPPKDLKEFISFVKANDNKLNVSHAGVGSAFFMTCLLLNALLDVKPTFVPFTGGPPAMNALLGGQVDYTCPDVFNALPHLRAGTIKAYAISTDERHPILPDVPTSKEAGLPEFQVSMWGGLFAPKATPKVIVDKLTSALDKALDDENTRVRLLEMGTDIPSKPQRGQQPLAALVKNELARWTPIINAANAKAE